MKLKREWTSRRGGCHWSTSCAPGKTRPGGMREVFLQSPPGRLGFAVLRRKDAMPKKSLNGVLIDGFHLFRLKSTGMCFVPVPIEFVMGQDVFDRNGLNGEFRRLVRR